MSGFTLLWLWMLLVGALAAAVVVTLVLVLTRRGRRLRGTGPRVWGLPDLLGQTSPQALRSYRRTGIAGLVAMCLAAGTGLVLTARPADTAALESSVHSRDIVLCLDVSGSALPFDRQVIAAYRTLVSNFRTERIGMSIFNSTSRTVFPLTDDYRLVKNQLDKAVRILSKVTDQKSIDKMSRKDYQAVSDWLDGTQNRHDATSLIGDGLVGCETMLPGFTATARSRQARVSPASIVFATDNVLSGTPLYTLDQAMRLARLNSISVDALYTGPASSATGTQATALKKSITRQGGTFRTQADADSVAALVSSIERQQVRKARSKSTVQASDAPWLWVVAVTLLFVLGLLLLTRVRR